MAAASGHRTAGLCFNFSPSSWLLCSLFSINDDDTQFNNTVPSDLPSIVRAIITIQQYFFHSLRAIGRDVQLKSKNIEQNF